MAIIFGSHTFTSPDHKLMGLYSGKGRFNGQQFLDGGYRTYHSEVSGQAISLLSILDTTGVESKLFGAIRWADIIALRAMPGGAYPLSHPLLGQVEETEVLASFDKTSLDSLTFYDPVNFGEPINPDVDSVYPGTDTLLMWYGSLNFIRTN